MSSTEKNRKEARKGSKGFTLVEVLVGTAIFLIVAAAAYSAFVSLLQLANASQARILGVELADEQFEIIRNMPYVNVGLTDGIPQGVLPQTQTLSRGGFTFTVTLVIRNQDLLATTTYQASTKLVEVDVACASCQSSFTPISLTGQVSPANLQSAGSGGALTINVFDSDGNPVQGASVVMQSTATSSITDSDTTDNSGALNIIGVAPGYQTYHVTATKSGYSTASTSPDATVVAGSITTVSLEIDKLSALNISSVGPTCAPVGGFAFNLTGSKMSGGSPLYSQNLSTDGSGNLTLNSMTPDTYTLTPTDGSRDAGGITPFSPFVLGPATTENVQLVVVPADENSLLVTVEDGNNSDDPLSGATVELSNASYGGAYDQTQTTGQGYFEQNDWSDPSSYSSESGVDTTGATSSGSIVLHWWGGDDPYTTVATATLESPTFDTGTTSNFYELNWTPTSQSVLAGPTPVAFQFATAASSTGPWDYLGPDGTSGSYYTSPASIPAAQGNNEYARYMAYLSTQTATVTPIIDDVSFTYTSGCIPPGQVLFQGVPTGTSTLTISKSGYITSVLPIYIGSGWQSQTVPLGQQPNP